MVSSFANNVFGITQYMPGSIQITVQLVRAPTAFTMVVGPNLDEKINPVTNYFIKCRDLSLSFRRINLTEAGRRSLQSSMAKPLCFNYRSLINPTVTIPANVNKWSCVVPGLSTLPSRMIVGLVSNTDLFGSYKTNSLCFKSYRLKELSLVQNGRVIDSVHVDNWDQHGTVLAYRKLLHTIQADITPDISHEQFYGTAGPYALFGLVATPDGSDENFRHPDGSLTLNFQFESNVPSPGLTAILFSVVQSKLIINRGQVSPLDPMMC